MPQEIEFITIFLPSLEHFIKYGPITFALVITAIFFVFRLFKKKKSEYMDLFVVGTTSSSVPSGLILICSGFDSSLIQKISDSNVYIPFACIALIFVVVNTIKEKFNA
jgi:hypothetical protein